MRYLASLFVTGLIAFTANPGFAQMGPGYGYGYGRMWNGGWGHGWFFGPLMMVLVAVGIIVLIAALWRWASRGPHYGHHGHYGHGICPHCGHGYGRHRGALDVLEERFAKGEIGTEEFEEKRKLLGS